MLALLPLPRTACISDPVLIGVLIAANGIIALSYLGISFNLAWIISRAPSAPFPAVWWLFGTFILFCGGTHACGVLVFFRPAFTLEAAVCSVTALVSLVTAILVRAWRRPILRALQDYDRLESRLTTTGL